MSRALWRTVRVLFPGFVHDVVWNHALCSIKEEVEWQEEHAWPHGLSLDPARIRARRRMSLELGPLTAFRPTANRELKG